MSNDGNPWDNANKQRSSRQRSDKQRSDRGRSGKARSDGGRRKPGQSRARTLGPRPFAARAIAAVVDDGKSLNEVMADRNALDPRDSALAQDASAETQRRGCSGAAAGRAVSAALDSR